jgi:hypothetical protein
MVCQRRSNHAGKHYLPIINFLMNLLRIQDEFHIIEMGVVNN